MAVSTWALSSSAAGRAHGPAGAFQKPQVAGARGMRPCWRRHEVERTLSTVESSSPIPYKTLAYSILDGSPETAARRPDTAEQRQMSRASAVLHSKNDGEQLQDQGGAPSFVSGRRGVPAEASSLLRGATAAPSKSTRPRRRSGSR